jgi:opacity protein-like surface antigen
VHLYDFATQYPGFGQVNSTPNQAVISPTPVPAIVTPEFLTSSSASPTETTSDTLNSVEHENDIDSGFYLGSRLLLAAAHVEGQELTGGRGFSFENNGEDVDSTAGLGFLAGYDWGRQGISLRTELEYAYRFRHDIDYIEVGTGSGITKLQNIGYENDLSTHSLMLSVFHDFSTKSKWHPYVGAGIGWARNSSSTRRTPNGNDDDQTIENSTDNLAYSLQTGVRFKLSSEWVGELGYRFINFGEVETGAFSDGDSVSAEHHLSHDLVIGVSYMY